MTDERLTVKNFAGIEELDIDVVKLTILFGHQAVGKSITLKLIFFFHRIREYIIQYCRRELDLNHSLDKDALSKYIGNKFSELFPVKYTDHRHSRISEINYLFQSDIFNIHYSVRQADREVFFDDYGLIGQIVKEYNSLKRPLQCTNDNDRSSNKSFRSDNFDPADIVEEIMDKLMPDELIFFIPSGRSFFSSLSDNFWSIREREEVNWDPVFSHFGAIYENLRKHYLTADLSSKLLDNTLNSKYVRTSGGDYLEENDGRLVKVSRSSSGQQELLPLAVALEVLRTARFQENAITIFIEEPEAHLFPDAQKRIVYEITQVINRLIKCGLDAKILLSSHSPYVMTSFNNLLEAGSIINEDERKTHKINRVMPKDSSLMPGITQAYFVNDTCVSIIDNDGLIDGDLLDAVSDNILDEFDQLQRL